MTKSCGHTTRMNPRPSSTTVLLERARPSFTPLSFLPYGHRAHCFGRCWVWDRCSTPQRGRTAYSRFKVPIPTLEDSTCSFTQNSDIGELMKTTKLGVWDEALMTHRSVFEAVDRSLKDIMRSVDLRYAHRLFGGITVVFGGDFRQIPPVVKRGSREDTIAACRKRSPLWPDIQ
jgi:hypothetical protein